jgi:hypothetical protein
MGEGAGHYWEGHWGLGSQPYILFFSGSFIEGSHVCIVLVFLNISAVLMGEEKVCSNYLVAYVRFRDFVLWWFFCFALL